MISVNVGLVIMRTLWFLFVEEVFKQQPVKYWVSLEYMSMNCVNSFKELLIVDDNELKPSLETKLSYFYWTTQYAPRTQVLILRSSNDRLPAITSYN